MKTIRTLLIVVTTFAATAFLAYIYVKIADISIVSTTKVDGPSPLDEEIMVMPTKGLLLEVSGIKATEIFERNLLISILGISVGNTVLSIRVPAHYRYQIDLAPEWKISRKGSFSFGTTCVVS